MAARPAGPHRPRGGMAVRRIGLPGTDIHLPVIGRGSHRMGRAAERRAAEVEALRLGISPGMTLIDTAEFCGGGRAEAEWIARSSARQPLDWVAPTSPRQRALGASSSQ